MRGPQLVLFFPLKIGEDHKKVFMSADVVFSLKISMKIKKKVFMSAGVFTENIGEDQNIKKVFVVCDEASHFLRAPPPFSLRP